MGVNWFFFCWPTWHCTRHNMACYLKWVWHPWDKVKKGGTILPKEYSILHWCEQTVGIRVHGDNVLAVWVVCQGFIDPVDESHFLFICGPILQIRHKQCKRQARITSGNSAPPRPIKWLHSCNSSPLMGQRSGSDFSNSYKQRTEQPESMTRALTSMPLIKYGAPKNKGLYSELFQKFTSIFILGK